MMWGRAFAYCFAAAMVLLLASPLIGQTSSDCVVPAEFQKFFVGAVSPDSHNALGGYYAERQQLACAEEAFQAALSINPKFVEARTNLGILYGQKGEQQAAEKLFRQAIKSNARYADAYIALGLLLAEQGRFREAEGELEKAIGIDAGNQRATTALGMVKTRLGAGESIEAFRKAVSMDPESGEARVNLGIALADQFQLDAALVEFSEAVRLTPNSAAARYNKGRILVDLKRYREAKPELQAALRLEPANVHALYLLARAENQLGELERSSEHLTRLVAQQPKHADALYLLGQNFQSLGKTEQSVAAWIQAAEANPNHSEALYNLSRTLMKTNPDQAKTYQRRFVALQKKSQNADRAESLANVAIRAAQSKDWPKALAQLREALELCGECRIRADLHKNLGLIYCHSGDLVNGERQLRTALTMKPHDADIQQALKVIEGSRTGK